MTETAEGGCFCGRVRYRFTGPVTITVNCHCTMCRRTSAAPFVSWLVVPTDQFEYCGETPKVLKSSQDGTRYFCGHCGTPVVCINAGHPEITDVTLGSLDEPERFPPTRDVYEDTRLSWVGHLAATPQ